MKLSDAVTIKSLVLKNRVVRSATWEGLATRDGACTTGLTELLGALVSGGAGLVITGFASVHPSGKVLQYMLASDDERRVQGLKSLTDHIHQLGGRVALQISHGGSESRPELIGDERLRVAFLPPGLKRPKLAAEMSAAEVAEMVECFARAAGLAQEAGFDALQIQASHGYLIGQFLSPLTNRRSDWYGGSLRNRSRFLFEVYEGVRETVGDGFPVLVKMNACDFVEGGLEFEEALWVMKELACLGIDAIEVSGGVASVQENGPVRKGVRPGVGEAYFAHFARAVREAVAPVPVIAVGGIRSFQVAQDLLASGAADLVALSRPLVCEPDLPGRWLAGDHSASSCISCNRCFLAGLGGQGIACRNRKAEP